MIIKRLFANSLLTLTLVASAFLVSAPSGYAQTDFDWSEPINLSNSGASTNPSLVIDSEGVIHVIWVDEFDGYKYTKSEDGITWETPRIVDYPFPTEQEYQPILLAGENQTIYIFWIDEENSLYYGQTLNRYLGEPTSWGGIGKLADSVIAFDVKGRSQGGVHLAFISNSVKEPDSAGVYYRNLVGTSWSTIKTIYLSSYFRSLVAADANVHVSATDEAGQENIYITWDDRPQKRIYLARSLDKGVTWEEATQLRGPDDSAGIEIPFNVNFMVNEGKNLLIWQMGLPGRGCTLYSQWSLDDGKSFEEPIRVLDEFTICPQKVDILLQNQDFSLLSFSNLNDLSLVAWNGSNWSNPQLQSEVSTFVNPRTFESVLLGCRKQVYYEESNTIYAVGCDEGAGGDIWFSSLHLGSLGDWFTPLATWTLPVTITSSDKKLSDLTMVADEKDRMHLLWVQTPISENDVAQSTIQYSQWNGTNWSAPVTINAGVSLKPVQLTTKVDSFGRLLLSWVDEQTGELLFRWVSSERAKNVSEWSEPVVVPTGVRSSSSPQILSDSSGRIVIGYAIPINEQRGLYYIDTVDVGLTWSKPLRIFDAVSAGWDMVDQPSLCVTADGRLHVLFGRYSFQGSRHQLLGLYYSQSTDGGVVWVKPEVVAEKSVLGGSIYCEGPQIVHRLWRENRFMQAVTYHQISQDDGLTWSNSKVVFSEDTYNVLTESIIDQSGTPHVFQLIADDGKVVVSHKMWNGSLWVVQDSKEIPINKFGVPTSVVGGITSNGSLRLSATISYPYPYSDVKNEILSIGKFLELPENLQEPYTILIPTADLTSIPTKETQEVFAMPTQPPLAELSDTTLERSRYRNVIGILLVVAISILTLIVIRPKTPKKH